jgi:quercetin dioxygenase-like cupin family protein
MMVDLAALASTSGSAGSIWNGGESDLNVNLVRFTAGDGVAAHVNAEVEVLLVGIVGTGTIDVNGVSQSLGPGQALVIPRGARRAITAEAEVFAYLTCHRRRAGLWPTGLSRPGAVRVAE